MKIIKDSGQEGHLVGLCNTCQMLFELRGSAHDTLLQGMELQQFVIPYHGDGGCSGSLHAPKKVFLCQTFKP